MSRVGAATDTRRTQRLLDVTVAGNFLAIGMLLSAVPRYVREELGGSSAEVGVATTIFFAAALVTRPVVGRWMDRVGRRPFLLWPLVGLGVLALTLEVVDSVPGVVAVRLAQGVFGSAFYVAGAAVVTDLAGPTQRASAVARLSLMIYLGFAVGPSLGELLFDLDSAWVWLAAAVLHLGAAACATAIPETLRPVVPGQTVSVPITRLARVVARPGLAQLTAGLGYACIVAFLPSYSREIGLGSSGALYFTYAASALVVRLFIGRVADSRGYLAVAVPGLAMFTAGLLLLAVAWAPWVPFPAVVLAGLGFGATFPALTAVAVSRASDAMRAGALGAFLAFNDLGNAIAGPLVGSIADAHGFRWSYATPAIAAACGTAIALTLREPAPQPVSSAGSSEPPS